MKAVLVSVKPRHCGNMASGKKTVEVRKTKPKLDTPFKCYIYCTNDSKLKFWTGKRYSYSDEQSHNLFDKCGNGKVIGEFVCDRIIVAECGNYVALGEGTMLSALDLLDYADEKTVYGWHISDLVIYDKPKELGEFFKIGHCKYCVEARETRKDLRIKIDKYNETADIKSHLNTNADFEANLKLLSPFKMKRPPQSWCYVESEVT